MTRSTAVALARHEVRSATRSRVLGLLTAAMVVIAALSITIAAYDFKAQLADYLSYLDQAKAAGVTASAPRPAIFPLQLLRGVIEYVQIIGAVIAIGLGYLTVARERSSNTLRLIITRPVTDADLVAGRLLGAVGLFGLVLTATAGISVLVVGTVGGTWLSAAELLKLTITFALALLYMLMFYALGAWLTARSRTLVNGLVIAMVVWLSVVLVLPQIGDTMDPDNQVPGGLFTALQVKKADEKRILGKFKVYEQVRNGLEETSLTKHFERASFAYTGIKDKYNDQPLAAITQAKRKDLEWLGFYAALATFLMWSGVRRERRRPAV